MSQTTRCPASVTIIRRRAMEQEYPSIELSTNVRTCLWRGSLPFNADQVRQATALCFIVIVGVYLSLVTERFLGSPVSSLILVLGSATPLASLWFSGYLDQLAASRVSKQIPADTKATIYLWDEEIGIDYGQITIKEKKLQFNGYLTHFDHQHRNCFTKGFFMQSTTPRLPVGDSARTTHENRPAKIGRVHQRRN